MSNNLAPQKSFVEILRANPYPVAELHYMLTSPRGEFFRVKLLSHLRLARTGEEIQMFKKEIGVEDYTRHLNKLIDLGLINLEKEQDKQTYTRTALGEKAINAVRELEREAGKEAYDRILKANLRHNSIRLFLVIYIENIQPAIIKHQAGARRLEVRYTPQQISHMTKEFQRTIDGIAAIDKLDSAGILEYRDDGYIYFNAQLARGFYLYLKNLFVIVSSGKLDKLDKQE